MRLRHICGVFGATDVPKICVFAPWRDKNIYTMSEKTNWADPGRISGVVKIWLVTGLVMIWMQIFLGGVTRLTGSGLSITRWEIVTGAIPPMSEAAWEAAFELYKETPQYHKINQGMSLDEFKFIFFWEYFHRLWARMMFFVFVFPFAWFLWRGMLSRELRNWLLLVVALAGLEGFFGWAMVASGLRDRPWVNAYNLTLHLCMGLVIFATLLWTTFIAFRPRPVGFGSADARRWSWGLFGVAFFQVALGAMMSGAKAGLFYPSWPDMGGEFLPSVLLDGGHWRLESFLQYDTNPFMPALIQFFHRNTAYLLIALAIWMVWKNYTSAARDMTLLLAALSVQVLLGIITLLNCVGHIPVVWGVAHQTGAVLVLGVVLWLCYRNRSR